MDIMDFPLKLGPTENPPANNAEAEVRLNEMFRGRMATWGLVDEIWSVLRGWFPDHVDQLALDFDPEDGSITIRNLSDVPRSEAISEEGSLRWRLWGGRWKDGTKERLKTGLRSSLYSKDYPY